MFFISTSPLPHLGVRLPASTRRSQRASPRRRAARCEAPPRRPGGRTASPASGRRSAPAGAPTRADGARCSARGPTISAPRKRRGAGRRRAWPTPAVLEHDRGCAPGCRSRPRRRRTGRASRRAPGSRRRRPRASRLGEGDREQRAALCPADVGEARGVLAGDRPLVGRLVEERDVVVRVAGDEDVACRPTGASCGRSRRRASSVDARVLEAEAARCSADGRRRRARTRSARRARCRPRRRSGRDAVPSRLDRADLARRSRRQLRAKRGDRGRLHDGIGERADGVAAPKTVRARRGGAAPGRARGR